jgi:hypothetical protein
MPTFRSTQLALTDLNPITKLNSSFSEGKLRVKAFDWTGDAAQNDLVQLCTLPKGARIVGGRIDVGALGTSVTIALGDGTTAAKYLAANTVAAAGGQANFADTYALYGFAREALAANITLTATLAGANPASGSIYGYVQYMVE